MGTLNYEGYELIELFLQVFPLACGAHYQSSVNDRHDSLWGYFARQSQSRQALLSVVTYFDML
jgi:hypothetical protein